ncbi:hemopexin repeat-containing protein [Nocardia abscessus]|uniref:hemopexin repeat-containing protein n=1 Tax=Nocardia abscessus TaxID=120957 RepID=UPI0024586A2D|nr:hemopexin repeat-containing protein [Nocardia abscessus]
MTKVALRSGNWIYFFCGDQYIRVYRPGDTGAGLLDGGPSNISAWRWPEPFGRDGIDAAFRSGTKTYFFRGNQYIRVTRGATGRGTVDPGYPGNISEWRWPGTFGRNTCEGLSSPGIDAAFRDGPLIYFFTGARYIIVDRPGDTGRGTLVNGPSNMDTANGGQWIGDGVDAAFRSGEKIYFFFGDEYVRLTSIDPGFGVVDEGYPRNVAGWGWPREFQERWSRIGSNFTFDNRITTRQRTRLLERHRFAYSQIQTCNHLDEEEREALNAAYHRPIRHGIETEPIDASSCRDWNRIFINFDVLFPKGDDEIAQTLIHEMMHVAGYEHSTRCTPERFNARLCNRIDRPLDGREYFESAPLRAEKCIAGRQSNAECVQTGQRYALNFL